MSAIRTDLEMALSDILSRHALGPENAPRILAELADFLAGRPDAVAELLPNHRLVKRSLTPKERAETSLPVANRIRLGKITIRRNTALATIAMLRAAAPAISPQEIAQALNERGIEPLRPGQWNADRVRRLQKG